MLEEKEVRDIDECDKEEFGTLDSRSPILGDGGHMRLNTGGVRLAERFYVFHRNNAMNA